MKIETFYPEDERLRNCIEYNYFLQADSPGFNSEYYAFPNTHYKGVLINRKFPGLNKGWIKLEKNNRGLCGKEATQ